MAKLTRQQRNDIEYCLRHVQRAADYINSARISICRRDDVPTTTLHFTRQPLPPALVSARFPAGNYTLYEVAKDIGSDLCGIQDALRRLNDMLAVF